MPCNKDFFGRAKSERQKEKANKGDIFSFICQENIIKCFGPGVATLHDSRPPHYVMLRIVMAGSRQFAGISFNPTHVTGNINFSCNQFQLYSYVSEHETQVSPVIRVEHHALPIHSSAQLPAITDARGSLLSPDMNRHKKCIASTGSW